MTGTPSPSQSRGRSRVRRWLLWCGISLVVLVAALFFARREIGGVLGRQLDKRLSAEGIFVTWRSADWVPGSGIVVRDLALYRDPAKSQRLALLGRANLIKESAGWSEWKTVGVSVADSQLTLSSGESETMLERLSLRLQIQPGRWDLLEGRCFLHGLRIEAKGSHSHSGAIGKAKTASVPSTAKDSKGWFEDVDLDWLKSVREWTAIEARQTEPLLTLEFQTPPAGAGMELTAVLEGKAFRWRGVAWDFVEARAKAFVAKEKASIEINRMRVGYAGRTAELVGAIDPAKGLLRIDKLESGLDVLAFTRAIAPKATAGLAGFASTGAWRVSGKGEVPLDRPLNFRWNGRVELDGDLVHATARSRVTLQKPACDLRVEESTVTIAGLKAGICEGDLDVPAARIHLPSGKTKASFDAKIKISDAQLGSVMRTFGQAEEPGVIQLEWSGGGGFDLASLTGSGKASFQVAEFFRAIEAMKTGPVLTLEFQTPQSGMGMELKAELEGKKFRWRGVDWDFVEARAKALVAKEKASVEINRVRVGYAGRTAEMAGAIDPASWLLRIDKLESGLDVLAFTRALAPKAMDGLAGFASTGAWHVSGKAEVPLNRPKDVRCNGHAEVSGDLIHETGSSRVVLRKPACALRFEKSTFTLTDLKAGLWEGDAHAPTGRIYLPSGKTKARFDARITIEDAQLGSVMRSFGQTEKPPGVIQFEWNGGGGFDLASLTGSGRASLQNAEFIHVPVIGGMGRLFDNMTPGFGRDTSTRGETGFRIGGGSLKLEDLVLDGEQIHLELDGTLDLKKNQADLAGEARIKGLAGVITSPLRARSAVEGKGPLGNVQWDLKRMGVSGLIGDGVESIDSDDKNKAAVKSTEKQPQPPRKPPAGK